MIRRRLAGTLAAAAVVASCGAAAAQPRSFTVPPATPGQPLLVPASGDPALPRRPFAPLPPERQAELAEARRLRAAGEAEKSRAAYAALLAKLPHHPLVAGELAALMLAKGDALAAERLARGERLAAKDSLLLAEPLVAALERLKRPRDAAAIALEAWAATPAAEPWARSVLARLEALDAAGVREAVRRGSRARPERADLARESARRDWAANDLKSGLAALTDAEGANRARLRATFAEELLGLGLGRDSSAAIETYLSIAADRVADAGFRAAAGRRLWDLAARRDQSRALAPRLRDALGDLGVERWGEDLRLAVARELSAGGRAKEARDVLGAESGGVEFDLERALNDLREGPPSRALAALKAVAERSPEHAFRYAEGLFYAGTLDSAHAWYARAAADPASANAGAALERLYLLEEEAPAAAKLATGAVAYERWRGNTPRASALADSLVRALPKGPVWATLAVWLGEMRLGANDAKGALLPLASLADSLPGDRLASLARQRAGEALLAQGDSRRALAQFEECLARYPRAWNAPEVRRRVDQLRRERRF